MATLDFKGKALVQNYHLTVKYHELVPKKDKSLTGKVCLDDNCAVRYIITKQALQEGWDCSFAYVLKRGVVFRQARPVALVVSKPVAAGLPDSRLAQARDFS